MPARDIPRHEESLAIRRACIWRLKAGSDSAYL
jgi:hypothetical protein